MSPSPNGPEQTVSSRLSPLACLLSPSVCASVPLCVRLCTTVRVCVHVIEPTDMQVVAVVIDTWAAPSEANSSSSSSDALRLRALLMYLLHAACKCRGNDAWRLSVSPGNMQHSDWFAHTALIKFAWPKPIGRAPLKGSFQCACTRAREREREHQGFAQQIVGALWQASSVKLQLFHCPLFDYFAPVVWLAPCLCMCACVCL